MKILPRANEVAAVTAILSSEEYDSPEAMGKAVVKAVMLELAKRETFALAHNDAPFEFFWPFFYEADAHKFNDTIGALPGTKCYVLPMRSPLTEIETRERLAREAQEAGERLRMFKETDRLMRSKPTARG